MQINNIKQFVNTLNKAKNSEGFSFLEGIFSVTFNNSEYVYYTLRNDYLTGNLIGLNPEIKFPCGKKRVKNTSNSFNIITRILKKYKKDVVKVFIDDFNLNIEIKQDKLFKTFSFKVIGEVNEIKYYPSKEIIKEAVIIEETKPIIKPNRKTLIEIQINPIVYSKKYNNDDSWYYSERKVNMLGFKITMEEHDYLTEIEKKIIDVNDLFQAIPRLKGDINAK